MKVLPRRRRAVLINSALGVVVLAGAGGAYATVNSDGGTPARAGTRTVTVAKGTVLATVSGSGSLTSPSDAGVNFTTGGQLTEVDVKPGDTIAKGKVLARVDATAAKEALAQDQASLTAAQANLTKVEEGQPASATTGSGGGTGGGSSGGSGRSQGNTVPTPTPAPTPTVDPAQLAQAQAQLTQAQNTVDAAQRAVDGTVLRSPVDGTVASVSAKTGQSVSGTGSSTAGGSSGGSGSGSASASGSGSGNSGSTGSSTTPTGFVVITNPTGMQVTADFSESDTLKLKPGQSATVTLNAESGTVLNAKVLSVSSLPVSSGSGSGGGSGSGSAVQYAATLAITSPTDTLRTGLSATIQVVTSVASGALYVPTAAVSGTGANRTVTVVEPNGSTQQRSVTVGVEGDTEDQIAGGLTEGEQVQITTVSSSGSSGFPSGAFPGGLGGAGRTRTGGATGGGGTGGGGFRTGGGGGRG